MKNLVHDLESALHRGEVVPHFQPQVDLRTGRVSGLEVLARWQHPVFGLLPPNRFVPLAEQSGLIALLNRSVMTAAFQLVQTLPSAVRLSVNISPEELGDRSLPSQIRDIAGKHGFPLNRLTVEITESALIDRLAIALPIALDLKALGVKLALDDFGTGYSSLTHLQALPFDELKVDRSFVSSMTKSPESRKIVAAVIGLGRNLGLCTVAEGIEDEAQAEMLKLLGCEIGQGWLYGRAEPWEEIRDHVAFRSFPVPARSQGQPPNVMTALEALPSSRLAQLQAIYDGAPVGLCFLDRDFRHVSLNRRLAEMNGIAMEQHIGKTVQELLPILYPFVEPYLRRARLGEAIQEIEVEGPISSDGDFQTFLMSYQPARDESGEVMGISVAVVDITEMKRKEQELQESEDHFRNLVELSPQMPWVMDRSGRVTNVNSRWQTVTGQKIDEMLADGWMKTMHPDDVERVMRSREHSFATGEPIDMELRVTGADGGWHWIRSRGAALKDEFGEIVRWYGVVEVIDDRKEAEQLAAEQLAGLQAIADALPFGIVIAEAPSGRIVGKNRVAEKLLDRPLDFTDLQEYSAHVPYYKNGVRVKTEDFPLARAIREGKATQGEVFYYDLGGGKGKWISITSAPVEAADGGIAHAVATLQELG